MNEDKDLKTMERKAFRSFFEDGLLELFIGLLFFCSVAGSILTEIGVSHRWVYPAIFAALLLYVWAKKSISLPRIGRAKFGPKRRVNLKKMFAVLIAVQLVTAAVLVLVWIGRFPKGPGAGMGLILKQFAIGFVFYTVPFGAMALFLQNPRMLIPAVAGWLYESLRGQLPHLWNGVLMFGTGGAALVILGAVMFERFIRKYPLPDNEEV